MNYPSIAHVLGTLLLFIAATMLFPLAVALLYGEGDSIAFLISIALTAATGAPVWWGFRKNRDLTIRDGVFIVSFGWILVSSVSALPFIIHGSIPSFTDAFFEMMSGYTTTGASILDDIEALPHGLLFWRSMTHLIGGMGFIMVTIILLPLLGIGGMQLYKAEADPGQVITGEKFLPRVKEAAMWLWGIYLGMIMLQSLLLWGFGMPLFDSLCHAFGTVSTSGYSTKNASLGHYDNAWFDWITIIFMFLGGMTFMLHFHILKKNWDPLKENTELRWYIGFVLFFAISATLILSLGGSHESPLDAARHATFQVVSILTTTGFTTTDYELWPASAQMIIIACCLIGACAGSTSSGIKVVHYEIISKYLYANGRKFLQPLAVIPVRINGRTIEQPVISLAVTYFIVNIFMIVIGGMVMTLTDGMDIASAMSAIVASLFNIGPGFGAVGPSHNFSDISTFGKWFLTFNMLTGRLEMFSVLVMFYPSFWKE